jgi:hypothetical protein
VTSRIALILLAAIFITADVQAQARMELVPSVAFSAAYDDNVFTTQEGSGDAMMLVTPAFEALYESPKATFRGLYMFDMQRAVGFSTLNSLDAKRHAMVNTGFQINPRFRVAVIGRYDVSDRPGDLMFDTGVLLGRQRAHRYQVTPAISFRLRPRTTITAQYDATKEGLGDDMRGDMYLARVGLSRMHTTRDVWSVNYLGRTFANGADMFNPAATERSHAVLFGYSRLVGVGTNISVQGGPRASSYANTRPELLANVSKQHRVGRVGLDYWQGETIIMGIRGPVDIQSFSLRSAWRIKRHMEFAGHAAMFQSQTLFQGRARVFHPEMVISYSPRSAYVVAGSYGLDFQKGDVGSEFLSDKEIVRHVFKVSVTLAPRLSRIRPADPNDPRSKGAFR